MIKESTNKLFCENTVRKMKKKKKKKQVVTWVKTFVKDISDNKLFWSLQIIPKTQ